MTGFNKLNPHGFKSDTDFPYNRVVFLHKPTGLRIACDNDPCVTDKDVWVVQSPGTELTVAGHVWVKGWRTGDDIRYWVERIEDTPLLLELVNTLDLEDIGFGVTDEFVMHSLQWLSTTLKESKV